MASRYEIEEQKKLFNELEITSEEYEKIFDMLKKGRYIEESKGLFLRFNSQERKDNFLKIIKEQCNKIGIVPIIPMPKGIPYKGYARKIKKKTGEYPSIINWYIYGSLLVAYYLIYHVKDHSLKNLISEIQKFANQLQINYIAEDYYNLDISDFHDYLKYLEIDENYLDIVLILRIVSDTLDLPLKGKSLEEYRKAIIKECEVLVK
ncbi:hypothetical protein GF396_03450 [Candidatus Pacearchaeota archaeon]|nr:hypothetical protein [Candidatus Pacearchaeota archaeon]